MRRKLMIGLIAALVLGLGATFGYMVSTFKTNEVIIDIGEQQTITATLTTDLLNKVLIPYNTTPTNTSEVTEYRFNLRIIHDNGSLFSVTHNLPEQYEVILPTSTFMANENYTIYIRLLEPVTTTQQAFYLNVTLL